MSGRRVLALTLLVVVAATVAGCDPAAQKAAERAACERRGGQMVGELHRVPRYKTDARGRSRLAGYTTEYRSRCVQDAR